MTGRRAPASAASPARSCGIPFRWLKVAVAVAAIVALRGPLIAQEVVGTEPNRGGDVDLASTDPAIALQHLRPAEGYEVSLFASERDFPIGNPVALTFDSRGRLWVATMPSYPHYKPGDPPTDKLVILEDTDGDGKADRYTVFADSLYLAAGFELGDGGVYVAQQPNLVFLRDTNGDGVADERRVILHGFGTEDSHHSISAFTWGPDGGLYLHEGTFHHSQVETPYGPVRVADAGIFRYEPHTERLSVFSSYRYSNPWGHVFDRWGQNFIADASPGHNYFALPISGRVDYPDKHPTMEVFTSKVRPTAGAEIVSSRHFPDDAQGNFLVTNVIGFHGIKNHRIIQEGSGFTSEEMEPLLYSTDINFRPIDLQFGPDGALYVVDWFNPLIGHMQYSLRDPRRDTQHGRIWRVTYRGRPLLEPVDLDGLSEGELLELLRTYEDRTRYRVRRELRERDREVVRRELARWVATLDESDPAYEHLLLEALWASQSRDLVDERLLRRVLEAREPRARAAATRVLRFWLDRVDDALGLLRVAVGDEHPLVRLEAVVALSFLDTVEAAETALLALSAPTDYYLDFGLDRTVAALESRWKPALLAGRNVGRENPAGLRFLLERLDPEERDLALVHLPTGERERYRSAPAAVAASAESPGAEPVDAAVRRVQVVAVEGRMRFDLESFTVAPGEEVELVLENADQMPHNLLIVSPGGREKVGRAADAMATRPDGFQRHFVPDLPEVLFATRLIGAGERDVLRFRAPEQTGDYPFVCTFPGHWLTMFGTMRVVASGGGQASP